MKRHYSIAARATREIVLTNPDVVLGRGPNVFTVTTADIDGVLDRLLSLGVDVHTVNTMAQPETSPADMHLEGNSDEKRLEQ